MPQSLYIGLMSGTSMDGIDAALVSINDSGRLTLLETHSHTWPEALCQQLQSLALPGDNEIDRLGDADAWAGELLAEAVMALLHKSGESPAAITAIGSHGQTVRHRPYSNHPFTLQIGDPNRIAALTGITTIADFRRRDMAVGGQGAPLAPAFHKAVFSSTDACRAIVNIGGIANLTILPNSSDSSVTGFDSGPGNRLMDDWIMCIKELPLDRNGDWAATGRVSNELLSRLADEPYFHQDAPKSTGTEQFNLAWLDKLGGTLLQQLPAHDVQATLLELTSTSIATAVSRNATNPRELFVCGGGAHNTTLMQRIKELLPDMNVASTASLGLDPDWVEAAAFAWLAHRTYHHQSGNLPAVTGAARAVPLGCIYPA